MSSFNGTGTFQISGTGLPFVAGTTISDTVANQLNTDLAAGLTNCLCKDGQQTATAVIPFAQGISIGGGTTLSTFSFGGFTPTDQSGAALSLTISRASYLQIGSWVFVEIALTYPATADGSAAVLGLGALPNCVNALGVSGMWPIYFGGPSFLMSFMTPNTNKFGIYDSTASAQTNASLSGKSLRMQFNYTTT